MSVSFPFYHDVHENLYFKINNYKSTSTVLHSLVLINGESCLTDNNFVMHDVILRLACLNVRRDCKSYYRQRGFMHRSPPTLAGAAQRLQLTLRQLEHRLLGTFSCSEGLRAPLGLTSLQHWLRHRVHAVYNYGN